ncbi:AmmeMemoRadiSam system radical SAM enzyme [Candidatus Margulisiibacteriota bacterium]
MSVTCGLCPKQCVIKPGQSGECRVRVNIDNKLTAVTYGFPCSLHIDPVEKKPLFHFLPGTGILSLATVGCNLHCKNCQNWEISQANPEDVAAYRVMPSEVVDLATRANTQSIAYTYTDPIIYYEYTMESSRLARDAGLKNVLVTAGYINKEPWRQLGIFTDAANIDLKSINNSFYRNICDASLKPVLDSLVLAKELGIWVEVTNLIIPTLNDSDQDLRNLIRWVKKNLGPETPLHFSRFHPQFRLTNLPQTSSETLARAYEMGYEEGLYYVYVGNLLNEKWQSTRCYKCKEIIIRRQGYRILEKRLQFRRGEAVCPDCGSEIHGIF